MKLPEKQLAGKLKAIVIKEYRVYCRRCYREQRLQASTYKSARSQAYEWGWRQERTHQGQLWICEWCSDAERMFGKEAS